MLRFMPKDVIANQGDAPNQFYLLLKGKVSKYNSNGEHEKDYLPGMCFNERAVIYQMLSTGTYIAKERTYVIVIKAEHYDQIIRKA